MPVTRSARLLAAVTAALAVAACAGDRSGDPLDAQGDGELRVVATTSILADLTSQVVGDAGTVETMIPAGADPHTYSPSASQVAALREADLIVANGLGLEAAFEDVLAAARADGVDLIEVAPQLDPLLADAADGSGHGVDDGHGHEAGEFDPHVWFDPVRMADGVAVIADAVAGLPDAGSDLDWPERGRQVADRVLGVHAELEELLGAVPADRRRLVTNHDALRYLAARYDFEVVATVLPGTSTEAQASARDVAELAELLGELEVPAIFVDLEASADVASALAADLGIEVVALSTGSLGGPGSATETYVDLLRQTATAIADALG